MDIQRLLEKEIDLIQKCIERMSQHSFYLKGWLITLLGILIALKPADMIMTNIILIFISISLSLWYLNATYLRYEKQYRNLYKWVIKERPNGNQLFLYDLDISREERFNEDEKNEYKVDSRIKLMFRNTLLIFYGSITLLLILMLIYNMHKEGILFSFLI